MMKTSSSTLVRAAAAWAVALLLFFPLAWLFLTAFKTELQAIAVPPLFVFEPTLANFGEVQQRSDSARSCSTTSRPSSSRVSSLQGTVVPQYGHLSAWAWAFHSRLAPHSGQGCLRTMAGAAAAASQEPEPEAGVEEERGEGALTASVLESVRRQAGPGAGKVQANRKRGRSALEELVQSALRNAPLAADLARLEVAGLDLGQHIGLAHTQHLGRLRRGQHLQTTGGGRCGGLGRLCSSGRERIGRLALAGRCATATAVLHALHHLLRHAEAHGHGGGQGGCGSAFAARGHGLAPLVFEIGRASCRGRV